MGLNFSSATTPELLLKTFDHYCEYRRTPNGVVLAPVQLGKWLVLFCDEINLPDMDKYGTQRVISFIRQVWCIFYELKILPIMPILWDYANWNHGRVKCGTVLLVQCFEYNPVINTVVSSLQMVEHGGFYRTSDQTWVKLERIQFVGACNPPTDPGRKPLTHRYSYQTLHLNRTIT